MAATMRPNGTTSDNKSHRPYAPNKTLILSPPGLSSRPEALNAIVSSYDRDVTDIQMLDRLAGGLVAFQDATYDIVLILTDADGTRRESSALLNRNTFSKIVRSLKVGGRLRSQDGAFGKNVEGGERREAILAGLIWDDAGDLIKPDESATQSVPLRFGKKATGTVTKTETPDATAKESSKPIGVGFVNFDDDLGDYLKYDDGEDNDEDNDDDDELIDEDTLLDEADLARPIIQRKKDPLATLEPGRLTNYCYSRRVSAETRQTSTGLQGLQLRSEGENRGRRFV